MFLRASIASAVILLSACSSPPILGSKDKETELKQFNSIPGQTSVYVCRDSTQSGMGFMVWLDEKPIGVLETQQFLHLPVAPGSHKITFALSWAKDHSQTPTLFFDSKGDALEMIWIGRPGGAVGSFFTQVTIDHFRTLSEGKDCVSKATYVVSQ